MLAQGKLPDKWKDPEDVSGYPDFLSQITIQNGELVLPAGTYKTTEGEVFDYASEPLYSSLQYENQYDIIASDFAASDVESCTLEYVKVGEEGYTASWSSSYSSLSGSDTASTPLTNSDACKAFKGSSALYNDNAFGKAGIYRGFKLTAKLKEASRTKTKFYFSFSTRGGNKTAYTSYLQFNYVDGSQEKIEKTGTTGAYSTPITVEREQAEKEIDVLIVYFVTEIRTAYQIGDLPSPSGYLRYYYTDAYSGDVYLVRQVYQSGENSSISYSLSEHPNNYTDEGDGYSFSARSSYLGKVECAEGEVKVLGFTPYPTAQPDVTQ